MKRTDITAKTLFEKIPKEDWIIGEPQKYIEHEDLFMTIAHKPSKTYCKYQITEDAMKIARFDAIEAGETSGKAQICSQLASLYNYLNKVLECETGNARLSRALKFYADDGIDGGELARNALEKGNG